MISIKKQQRKWKEKKEINSTYIESFKKLHSISNNYLVFDASWDELAAEQKIQT
jgi:hypothetical protein